MSAAELKKINQNIQKLRKERTVWGIIGRYVVRISI